MGWEKDGYYLIKNALNKDLCLVLASQFRLQRDTEFVFNGINQQKKKFYFGDSRSPKSFSFYGNLAFEALTDTIVKEKLEKVVGIKMLPTYSYARIYYKGASFLPHLDRASCEYSVTCCIDSDEVSWPLGILTRSGQKKYIHQKTGDILIYAGRELEHWRNKFQGKEHIQVFCHYVNANGEYASLKNDMRPSLGIRYSPWSLGWKSQSSQK